MKTISFDDIFKILEALELDDTYINDAFWDEYYNSDNKEIKMDRALQIMRETKEKMRKTWLNQI